MTGVCTRLRAAVAAGLVSIVVATPLSAEEQTHTDEFLIACRALAESTGKPTGRAAHCHAMLEGAIGAFSLLTKQYMPISGQLGYCLEPGLKPKVLAAKIVGFADKNAECGKLAHFSMCLDMALEALYPDSC